MYDRALKIIREYHRMSQKDVAENLGISKSYLSEIEGGKKQPSLDILERYSELFKIPMSSIVLFAEKSRSTDAADRFRGFAADKILKILEWLQATNNTDGDVDGDKAAAGGLSPVRDRLSRRSRSPSGDQRRCSGATSQRV